MDILTIVAVGVVSTIYMFGIQWCCERLGLVKGSLVHDVGTFTIPEPFRNPVSGAVLHIIAGLVFTGVYAFVFSFVQPLSIAHFMELGLLIGVVHGTLVTFFAMMGFSSNQEGLEDPRGSLFAAGALNIVAHIIFGLLVGLGFGYTAYRGTPFWFTAYGIVIAAAVGAVFFFVVPKRGPTAFELEERQCREDRQARRAARLNPAPRQP